jgi:hypothetical protein
MFSLFDFNRLAEAATTNLIQAWPDFKRAFEGIRCGRRREPRNPFSRLPLGIRERKSADASYIAILSPKPASFKFNNLAFQGMTNLVNPLTRNVNTVDWPNSPPINPRTYLQNFPLSMFAR